MLDKISFEVNLFSPRWGHEDSYKIELSRKQMIVKLGIKTATCSWVVEGRNPEWSGYLNSKRNPLEDILRNDSIFPPINFVHSLEHAWEDWRDGLLDDNEIHQEVEELCEWINKLSRIDRPRSEYWQSIFYNSGSRHGKPDLSPE